MKLRVPRLPRPSHVPDTIAVALAAVPAKTVGVLTNGVTEARVFGSTTKNAFGIQMEEAQYNCLSHDLERREVSHEVLAGLQTKTASARERYIETVKRLDPAILPEIARRHKATLGIEDIEAAEAARTGADQVHA